MEPMSPIARPLKTGILCILLRFMALFAGLAYTASAQAQSRPQNPLETRNVLILNAFESNIPSLEKTNQGLSAILESGFRHPSGIFPSLEPDPCPSKPPRLQPIS